MILEDFCEKINIDLSNTIIIYEYLENRK
jgi:hypothetical protein